MNKYLAYIGYFILICNFIFCIKSFPRNGKAFVFFTAYLGSIVLVAFTSEILNLLKYTNLFLSHFYFIFQFIFLSLFYSDLLIDKKQIKVIRLLAILIPIIFIFQYLFYPNLFFKFNLIEVLITSLLIIVYTTFHLYNLLVRQFSYYYICIGILIYLFGSTFLFLFGNYLASLNSKFSSVIYSLNSLLYILYQILIFYELNKNFKNKTDEL